MEQPKTTIKLDKRSFERIKKTVSNMSMGKRMTQGQRSFSTELPQEIGLQLTNRCNLRCKHCFEWSESGYNNTVNCSVNSKELPFEVVEKCFRETEKIKSNLFLWGGEPMVYKHWNELVDLLDKDPRWSVLCTNGILVEDSMEGLLRISGNLAILTSIEGFEEENDIIRGKGSYKRVLKGINEVIRLQKKGDFKGKQSIHCTINDAMIGKLYGFVEYMEEIGVDTVYLCFPWYISKEIASEMDSYFSRCFSWLNVEQDSFSWYSFDFHVNPEKINELKKDLQRINNKNWNLRVRYQPAVEMDEVKDFVSGKDIIIQNKTKCLALCNRMDVLADGAVSACKLFREFCVGNLLDSSIGELWKSEKFDKIRSQINKSLMPVCSRCILLYLNGQ